MASSSTSSIQKCFKYDVFLSFRGEDTRKTFVGHLFYALQQKSIHTYKDDENLEKGKQISKELIQAIQDSRFHIIVFSKNYASSSWCLEELVNIMECQKTAEKTAEQTAYPVFYDVEPTEVRKQIGEFGAVFAKHEKEEAVRKWREALKEAADLAGWELKKTDDGDEAKFIRRIVEEISLELRCINFSIDEKLVGMEARIRDVVSSLEIGHNDVRMIGIKGMGGGGKTTLARVVFDKISTQFEGKSFVENVREVSNGSLSGLKSLQEKILRNVLNDKDITVDSVYDGKNMLKRMMCGRKVLLVLDDVDHIHQLEALAGGPSWFKPGSRIIVTTRDEQLLAAHRVNLIHDVSLLSNGEALCLFSRYAFGKEIPIQGYEKLSSQVVLYAAGLPLTITVLGSFLCGKIEDEWRSAIQRLETIPSKDTLDILEISYIGLEEEHKEMFLDVACILKGWPKEVAIRALESCGFYATIGLRVLEQKSLITISEYGWLDMHDRIEEMGQYIVRRKLEEPNKHSRLWIGEEIKDILVSDQGTNEAVRCIKLITSSDLDPKIVMEGLGNMKKLRFLQVYCGSDYCFDRNWKLDEVREYFPNALRWLTWEGYPFGSLPKSFQANNLVQLEMPGSKIEQLWEGGDRKVLNKLRFLDLSNSKNLKNLDLGLAPNLEILDLQGCSYLVELHMPIECLKLEIININRSKLRTLDLRGTPNLETLRVKKCVDLVELHIPVECLKLEIINIYYSKLRTLDLRGTPNLERLELEWCKDLVELQMPVECLKLEIININRSKLRTLDLRGTPNLETLAFIYCVNLVELHMPVKCPKLKSIIICDSKLTALDLRGTWNLERLHVEGCVDLVELRMPVECLKLKSIDINDSKLTTLDLRGTPNLEKLKLEKCVDLVELHMPVECLKLKSININDSQLKTFDVGLTPNLTKLSLTKCHSLVELQAPFESLKKLAHLDLNGCSRFKSFSFRKGFEKLEVAFLDKLDLIVESLDMCPLHSDNNLPKFRFTCSSYEHLVPPSLIRNLEKLIPIGLCACTDLERFSRNICGLQWLTKLTLEGDIPEAPKDLGQLECLVELSLSTTKITHLPESICMLKHLKILKLQSCWRLEKLPEDLCELECLEDLILSECIVLRDIPNSICKMKRLKSLHLLYCFLVEKLPDELGCLECLVELNIEGTGISHLPPSIFSLKGLLIVGFRWLLESFGFTSVIQIMSANVGYCRI